MEVKPLLFPHVHVSMQARLAAAIFHFLWLILSTTQSWLITMDLQVVANAASSPIALQLVVLAKYIQFEKLAHFLLAVLVDAQAVL